jgi:hypothetical protein
MVLSGTPWANIRLAAECHRLWNRMDAVRPLAGGRLYARCRFTGSMVSSGACGCGGLIEVAPAAPETDFGCPGLATLV